MDIKDIIITPLFFGLIMFAMYRIQYGTTTPLTRQFFMPALILKLSGAIFLGLIYQFYYSGGDTFNYFHESKIINSALYDSFSKWLILIFSDGTPNGSIYEFTSRLYWFRADSEFLTSKITSILSIFTFDTYSSTALLFAVISFSGLWAMYKSFLRIYPDLYKEFALAFFFVPSVFFWGSGVMKDTITLGCISWLFYACVNLFILKRKVFFSILILFIAVFVIKTLRVYILLAFLPPLVLWIFLENNKRIRSGILRLMTYPFFIVLSGVIIYFLIINVSKGDSRYALDQIGTFTKINAEYLYYVSVQQGGSAYYLGELDGTITGTLQYVPSAIWVTLFRPYLWEVNNIVMLLSAIESLILLLFTIYTIIRVGPPQIIKFTLQSPLLQFCLIFSLIFAFAVGITSFNFGTLVRYKIPIMPFFLSALFILNYLRKKTLTQSK